MVQRAVFKVQSVAIPCTDVDVILGTDLGPVGGESGGPGTNHRHEQKEEIMTHTIDNDGYLAHLALLMGT